MKSTTAPVVTQPVPVSPGYWGLWREQLSKQLAKASKIPGAPQLLWALLAAQGYAARSQGSDGRLMVSGGLLEAVWGDLRSHRQRAARDARLEAFVALMCEDGVKAKLEYEKNPHGQGQVTWVTAALPDAMLAARQRELTEGWAEKPGELRDLFTGVAYDRWARQERYELKHAEARARIEAERAAHPEAVGRLRLMDYYERNLTPSTTALWAVDIQGAIGWFQRHCPAPTTERGGLAAAMRGRRESVGRALRRAVIDPTECFLPSKENASARLYHHGLMQLPQELRRTLCPNLWIYDLSAAHLRIAAKLWSCDTLARYIDECDAAETTFWVRMATDVVRVAQVESTDALVAGVGRSLKEVMYSLVCGRSEEVLYTRIYDGMALAVRSAGLVDDDESERLAWGLIGSKVMTEILERREAVLFEIEIHRRDVMPATGQTREMVWTDSTTSEGRRDFHHQTRSLLAAALQDVECDILSAAIEYAEQHTAASKRCDVRSLTHDHDGSSWMLRRSQAHHMRRIDEACCTRAAAHGISMRGKWVEPLTEERKRTEQTVSLEVSAQDAKLVPMIETATRSAQ